tara:strand:- start:1314 stop:1607 length:294 start_codon:yes stop_codon:yes gene_type:complete
MGTGTIAFFLVLELRPKAPDYDTDQGESCYREANRNPAHDHTDVGRPTAGWIHQARVHFLQICFSHHDRNNAKWQEEKKPYQAQGKDSATSMGFHPA